MLRLSRSTFGYYYYSQVGSDTYFFIGLNNEDLKGCVLFLIVNFNYSVKLNSNLENRLIFLKHIYRVTHKY